MLIITNPDAQILAAEAGELDILSDIARPSDIDRLGADPKLKMSLARGMHAFFLLLNNKNFPWDDAVVRRAAAMSIDRADKFVAAAGLAVGAREQLARHIRPRGRGEAA